MYRCVTVGLAEQKRWHDLCGVPPSQEILAKYGALPGASGAAQPVTQSVPPPVAAPTPPSAIPPHIQAQIPPRGGTPTYPPPGPQGGFPPQGYQGVPPSLGGPPGPGRGYGTPPPGPSQVPGFVPPHAPQQPPHVPGVGVPGLSHGPPHAQLPTHMQLPHASQPPPVPGPAPAAPVLPPAFAALPEDQRVRIYWPVVRYTQEVCAEHECLQALIMRVIAMSREEVYQMPPADRENIIKLVSSSTAVSCSQTRGI